MEYSCKVAGSKLVFVLGHEDCGAVKVACDCVKVGNITSMLENIKPAVDLSKKQIAGVKNSSNKEFVEKTINSQPLKTDLTSKNIFQAAAQRT